MRSPILSMVLAGMLFSCAPKDQSPETVNLKFNLEKGKTYDYDMILKSESPMGDSVMTMNMAYNFDLEVLENNGEESVIKTTYNKLQMKISGSEYPMEMDSEAPEDLSGAFTGNSMYRAMKGKSFLMTVTDKGEIRKVEGFNKIFDDMFRELNLPEEMKESFMPQLKSQFNDENLKNMFGQNFRYFPDKPVKEGDSWNRNISMNLMTPMTMAITYTVRDIQPQRIIVASKASMDVPEHQTKGVLTGEYIIDPKTGFIREARWEQKNTGPQSSSITGTIYGKEI